MRPIRTLALLVTAAALVQAATAWPASASFNGGDGRIAFETGRTDEFDLWIMKPGGFDKKRLTHGMAEDHSPSWDRGGSQVVFARFPLGEPFGDLYRIELFGHELTQLTDTPHIAEFDPVWSPFAEVPLSQNLILFASSRTGHDDLYTIRASDGGNLTRLTFSPKPDFQPDWSIGTGRFPKGRIVFVSMRTGHGDLYVMRPNGKGLRQLTSGPALDLEPSWDPDGKRIAFVSDRGGDNEIYVINVDGTGLTKLTENAKDDEGPAWSPQGDRIAFMSNRDETSFEIYTMEPDGTHMRRLTHDDFVDGFPAWQPLAG
jgi:Tol biopolymer transport system component